MLVRKRHSDNVSVHVQAQGTRHNGIEHATYMFTALGTRKI